MLADEPLDFENLRSPANAAPDWRGWSNNIDMCRSEVCFTERSCMARDTHINFLWLLFILVDKICPPLILRLNKGFRSFNFFSKVPPGSE